MVTLDDMAQTVTIYDPATDSTFRATRLQWVRLHKPAGRKLVADENGNPPPKVAGKRTSTEPAAE